MSTIADLILIRVLLLIGEEGVDWECYETDPDWWKLRLWTRRN